MRAFNFVKYNRKLLKNAPTRGYCSSKSRPENTSIENIRNIGILAHIDAGKTTTTERMLFYSGTIRSMGEVHHGNTVTDCMEQERQRGITITSAAVSFPWAGGQINLIDTPGHIDFTMEVEQSLAVLDGAVIVLDASAGVEAQTLTVWRQAAGYRVPRLLYLNKMDRGDADVTSCVESVRDKLQATPALLHLPVRYEGKLIGLIDLVTLEEIIWTQGRGQKFTRRKLTEKEDGPIWESSMSQHRNLVDTISTIDDTLADIIIQEESLDNLNKQQIDEAIRRCTIDMKLFPVLCGSSYKNIGVQTLMDAVISYLPSPLQCNELYKCFDSDLAARAFKVQHDDQRGVLTFMRLYSGDISKGQKIYNLGRDKSEQAGPLYVALADEYRPVEKVTAGNIAVVSGLKTTMTGDLITSTQSAASRARTRLASRLKAGPTEALILPSAAQRLTAMEEQPGVEEMADLMLGIGTTVPEPVFFCTIEPPSAGHQQALEAALAELQREDPSLRVEADEEAGQLLLAGMGELHLEIVRERIVREYKIDAELGALRIAYREALAGEGRRSHTQDRWGAGVEYKIDAELGALRIAYREALAGEGRRSHTQDRKIGNTKQLVNVTMSARTVKGLPADKVLRLDKSPDSAANLAHLHTRQMNAIKQGVESALLHGPKLGCKMVDVQVTLHWLEIGRGTSDSVVSATVAQCLRKLFSEAGSLLLEPVMALQVVCPESHSPRVVADLARRRAHILGVSARHNSKVIDCLAPLSELLGYSSALRSLSSGLASFTMQFHSDRQMAPHDEEKAIRSITGF